MWRGSPRTRRPSRDSKVVSKNTLYVRSAIDAIRTPGGEPPVHALHTMTWGTMQLSALGSRVNSTGLSSSSSSKDYLHHCDGCFSLHHQRSLRCNRGEATSRSECMDYSKATKARVADMVRGVEVKVSRGRLEWLRWKLGRPCHMI